MDESILTMDFASAFIEEAIASGEVFSDPDTPDDRGRVAAMIDVEQDAQDGVECRHPSRVDCVLAYLQAAIELIQVHQKRPLRVVVEWDEGGVGVPLRDSEIF